MELQITTGGLTPTNLTEAMQLAEILAQSTIVPKDYQRNPGNILVAIQWGAELGLAPMQAMQNIATINGRPSIWGDAMLALVKNSSEFVSIKEEFTGEDASLTAVCTIARKGQPDHTTYFSVEDARKAGLWGKQGPWTQYPRRMLQMRARGYALRDMFPDVLKGMRTAEEVRDMPKEKDMGDVEQVAEPESKSARDKVIERLNRSKEEPKAEVKAESKPQQTTVSNRPSQAELLIIKLDSVETAEQLKPLYEECKEFAKDELAIEIKAAYQSALARIRAEDAEIVESSN